MGYIDAEHPGGLEVDDQIKLRWLLDREIAGLCAANNLVDFLGGASRQMIEQVETDMRAAAEKLDFERAAQLRNLLDDLKRTTKPMTRFTRKALPNTIDPQEDLRALADALQLGRPPRIEYIEMPEAIRDRYQYFTQADIGKLRGAGYERPITPLDDAVRDYVLNYLMPGKSLGEGADRSQSA
jgi:hypothetical protein